MSKPEKDNLIIDREHHNWVNIDSEHFHLAVDGTDKVIHIHSKADIQKEEYLRIQWDHVEDFGKAMLEAMQWVRRHNEKGAFPVSRNLLIVDSMFREQE